MFSLVSTSFTPSTTAIGANVFLTALAGILPLLLFFVLLGAFKVKTHWCALISLVAALLIAVFGYKMQLSMSLLAAGQGIVFALIPIIYIIIAAVWLYNLTEVSGRSKDMRAVFNTIGKGDIRVQALIIAFSFCGLLEGLAGFGAPVAIVAAMLVSLGLPPVKAAVVTIVGNAINVGFGAMAIPTTTAGRLGGQNPLVVAANMGHLSWIFACFIPLLLLWILDGGRGVAQLWPIALISGVATAAGHFFTSEFSYELTAVLASLLGLAASYIFLLVWTPKTPDDYRSESTQEDRPNASRITLALLPYVLVVVVIAITKLWKIGVDIDAIFKSTDMKSPRIARRVGRFHRQGRFCDDLHLPVPLQSRNLDLRHCSHCCFRLRSHQFGRSLPHDLHKGNCNSLQDNFHLEDFYPDDLLGHGLGLRHEPLWTNWGDWYRSCNNRRVLRLPLPHPWLVGNSSRRICNQRRRTLCQPSVHSSADRRTRPIDFACRQHDRWWYRQDCVAAESHYCSDRNQRTRKRSRDSQEGGSLFHRIATHLVHLDLPRLARLFGFLHARCLRSLGSQSRGCEPNVCFKRGVLCRSHCDPWRFFVQRSRFSRDAFLSVQTQHARAYPRTHALPSSLTKLTAKSRSKNAPIPSMNGCPGSVQLRDTSWRPTSQKDGSYPHPTITYG